MKKILLIHGPNLNLLGEREVDVYGKVTIDEINGDMKTLSKSNGIELEAFQSIRKLSDIDFNIKRG